jgi:hypothetical protein
MMPDREMQIIDAIHAAMMEGLKISSWDKNVRLLSTSLIALLHHPTKMSVTLLSVSISSPAARSKRRRPVTVRWWQCWSR